MVNKDITAEKLREMTHYDPITGIFTWRVRPAQNVQIGDAAGAVGHGGYVAFSIHGWPHRVHRLAFLYMEGSFPPALVDHINGVRSDNRWSNLRHATKSLNGQNRKIAASTSKSGLIGASPTRNGKWWAQIKSRGVHHNLGVFDTAEEAHQAYVSAKRLLHPFNTL